jgi:hypothetical protein
MRSNQHPWTISNLITSTRCYHHEVQPTSSDHLQLDHLCMRHLRSSQHPRTISNSCLCSTCRCNLCTRCHHHEVQPTSVDRLQLVLVFNMLMQSIISARGVAIMWSSQHPRSISNSCLCPTCRRNLCTRRRRGNRTQMAPVSPRAHCCDSNDGPSGQSPSVPCRSTTLHSCFAVLCPRCPNAADLLGGVGGTRRARQACRRAASSVLEIQERPRGRHVVHLVVEHKHGLLKVHKHGLRADGCGRTGSMASA